MIKHSAAWWCFVRDGVMDGETFVRTCADLGYDGIELPPTEAFAMIRNAGLAISGISGHQSIASGLNRRENHDRIVGEIEASLELAVRWQIPALICFSGERQGLDDAAGAAATIDGLRRLAPLAEQAGVALVLELLNSRVDHPDYQCDHVEWGVGVIQAVASPRIKLLYDIYHAQIMDGHLIATIRQHNAQFGHYHTAGNPGRHEIDDTQEINYPPVIAAIRATGYDGWLAQEFVPVGETTAALRDTLRRCQ